MSLMTKDGFWNEIEKRWPGEFHRFGKWIDDYKKNNHWKDLFKITIRDKFWSNIKYHDLPDAMQLGIFIEYTVEESHHYPFEIQEGTMEGIIRDVMEWFCQEEETKKQDSFEEKYMDD